MGVGSCRIAATVLIRPASTDSITNGVTRCPTWNSRAAVRALSRAREDPSVRAHGDAGVRPLLPDRDPERELVECPGAPASFALDLECLGVALVGGTGAQRAVVLHAELTEGHTVLCGGTHHREDVLHAHAHAV